MAKNAGSNDKCWYCGSSKMQPDKRGYVCRRCGATWTASREYQRIDTSPTPGQVATAERMRGRRD